MSDFADGRASERSCDVVASSSDVRSGVSSLKRPLVS